MTTVKLFAISMATVGSLVSEEETGPYRRVTEVQRFGDVRRIWLEPLPDAPEYLDRRVGDLLWQPNQPELEPDPADEARRFEAEMEARAAGFDRPSHYRQP